MLKMLVMSEGMAVRLDPEFQLGDALAPYARRLVAAQLSPAALARRLGQAGVEAAQLGIELPEQLRRLLDALDRDDLGVHLRAGELEPLVLRAERLGNRLVAGVITAAVIDALTELIAADPSRRRWDRPLLTAGLGAVGSLGTYLAWTARRGPRRRVR